MNNYIETLYVIIKEQINENSNNSIRVCLKGFDAEVYYKIIEKFNQFTSQNTINLTAKVSYGRFNHWQINKTLDKWAEKLYSEGYIDKFNHLTSYRNKTEKENGKRNLIILMGIESIEDKGSLEEFFTIDTSHINDYMKGKYHEWFSSFLYDADEYKDRINDLIEKISKLSGNISSKLSNLLDRIEEKAIVDFESAIEYIFSNLKLFDIPNIKSNFPFFISTRKKNRFEIIDKAKKFIDKRQVDNKTIKKALEITKKKFDFYVDTLTERGEDLDKYRIKPYNNNDEFRGGLLNYIETASSFEREKIMEMDFSLIDEILELKLPKTRTTKTKKRIRGNPFRFFITFLSEILIKNRISLEEIESISFTLVEKSSFFNRIEVADIIRSYLLSFDDYFFSELEDILPDLKLSYPAPDEIENFFFGDNDSEKLIKPNKKNSEVAFGYEIIYKDDELDKDTIIWKITPDDIWLYDLYWYRTKKCVFLKFY